MLSVNWIGEVGTPKGEQERQQPNQARQPKSTSVLHVSPSEIKKKFAEPLRQDATARRRARRRTCT